MRLTHPGSEARKPPFVPHNEVVLESMPPLVIDIAIVFNWGDAGWSRGVIKRVCNARQKRKGFRWLVCHDGERWPRPHAPEEDKYKPQGQQGHGLQSQSTQRHMTRRQREGNSSLKSWDASSSIFLESPDATK